MYVCMYGQSSINVLHTSLQEVDDGRENLASMNDALQLKKNNNLHYH